MTRNEKSLQALFSTRDNSHRPIKSIVIPKKHRKNTKDEYLKISAKNDCRRGHPDKEEEFFVEADYCGYNLTHNDYEKYLNYYNEFNIQSSRRPIKSEWTKVRSKQVQDSDGWWTDYTMYVNEDGKYICMFGDSDIYEPDEGYADWEGDSEEEAEEWFESYNGIYDNDEINSSRKPVKSSTGTIHCVYLSDITPAEWTKDMALAAIKNSVTNYGYYEYNGKKGLCIVGDFEDIYNFIESVGHVVDEDNLYHWKEFNWDSAKKLDKRYTGQDYWNRKGIGNSHRPIKSGYAPYYNDSTISEKGKKAYEWLCDFVGQKLKLGSHPWYGPCVYLNVNKMNITQDMLEEINNKMYEMDGYNSITADSGSWGYGDVYIVTFDQIRKE